MKKYWAFSIIFILGFLIGTPFDILAQSKIKIIGAKRLKQQDSPLGPVRQLIGDVRLKQDDTFMFCDSAVILEDSNIVKAFGNVRMNKGDSLFVEGDSLRYYGNKKIAKLRGNILLEDPNQKLKTNYLNYDMSNDIAYYLYGGTVTNKKDNTQLKSESGYYYSNTNQFIFEGKVSSTTDDYIIDSDTMHYNTLSKQNRFFGPTTIWSDSTEIYCEYGWLDQENDLAVLSRNASIKNKETVLKGDSIRYKQEEGFGEIFGHAWIEDTANHVIVTGDYAWYNQVDSTSFVTGKAQMIQVMDQDSLFLHADTLQTVDDSTGTHKEIQCFHHVKFFKKDIQGKCDSMVFFQAADKISMYREPTIWSDSNQITGEHLNLFMNENSIDSIEVIDNALIVSQFDSIHFNQIRGRLLTAYFKENDLYKVFITGNGESNYFIADEKELLLGMNHIICSDFQIDLKDNAVQNIKAYVQPDATFYPPKDFSEEILFFRSFVWLDEIRPKSKFDIFNWP